MTTDSKSELSDLSLSHSQSSSSVRLWLEYPGKEESVSNDKRFQASSPPASPHGSVAGSLESTPDKAKIAMHKGKVHMILHKTQKLEKTISESIMPYLKGIHEKMDVFAKTGDGLDEVKARLQALKTQQNRIKKHVQANNGVLLKNQGQNAAKQMDVTLLSNQLEKLGDKFESLKKVLSPGDVDALLNEREVLRKEKNSEIRYLQDELARARGRKNFFGVFHLLLVLVVAVILAYLSQIRFRKNTYGTL